jgi:hypothetical protein
MLIEKSNDLIENPSRDLWTCSIVPQPTTLPGEYGTGVIKTLRSNIVKYNLNSYRKTNSVCQRMVNREQATMEVNLEDDEWEDRVARRRLSKEQGEAG